jgi:DNA-binding NarL/FixJ family response regulator
LRVAPDIEVVASLAHGMEVIMWLEEHSQERIDLILMDLKMPVMNGVEATRHLRSSAPQIKILILTTYDDDAWLFDAIRNGAQGYLLKDTPPAQIMDAIRHCVHGKHPIDPSVAGKLLEHIAIQPAASVAPSQRFAELNDREREILACLARGLSNQAIAQAIFLSEGTVRNYVSTILAKLGVHDRTHAALLAIRYGLIPLSEIPESLDG